MGCQIAGLKCIIIFPNLFFFGFGCLSLFYGTSTLITYREEIQNAEDDIKMKIYGSCGLVIAAGLFLCISSSLAICGALADKTKMLKAYAIILSVVIALQITVAVLAFLAESKIEEKEESLRDRTKLVAIIIIAEVGFEIILALSACFLSTKIKHERRPPRF